MERKSRTCSVCRRSYKFCPSCREDSDKPLWYFSYCSENCKKIYEVTSNFEDGLIDEKTAKEQLRKLDLSRLDNFGTSYVASINKIMSSAVKNDAVVCDDCIVNTDENENVVDNKGNIENIDNENSIKKSKTKRTKSIE